MAHWRDETGEKGQSGQQDVSDYMYLSDTQEGWMFVLQWIKGQKKLDLVVGLRYPDGAAPYEAVWLD